MLKRQMGFFALAMLLFSLMLSSTYPKVSRSDTTGSTSISLDGVSSKYCPLGFRGRQNGMKVDNIRLQGLECLFFTVLFAFREEWTGFTYQSQAEVDQ